MLELAIKSNLPLIYVRTDDLINVEDVLDYISETQGCGKVKPINVPAIIDKVESLKKPSAKVCYTSNECKDLAKLYSWAVENDLTIIFVNTEKSVLHFDGGTLFPPKELMRKFVSGFAPEDKLDELLPCFGGLTLKDAGEIAQLTMTRDESLTPQGVNETRRGYMGKLRGIQQVDTRQDYYIPPAELQKWLDANAPFFVKPIIPALVPRGLLADGPPGTGKTEGSKYISNAFGVPLYRLDLGQMMGKYVGDSEGNMDAAMAQIDQVEPCVVILDEIEKVFKNTSDSGVTSRMLSQLLWWLQEHKSRVFTVMTTNEVAGIPDELHREGRIDCTLQFLGLESKTDGFNFAKGAFDTMAKQAELKTNSTMYTAIQKRMNTMFQGNTAVPQAKVIKAVHDMIREFYLKQQAEE